jgi:hypothetical protein
MIRATLFAAALLTASPAWATDVVQQYTGHDLRALCIHSNGICHGFVVGVADAAIANGIACPPDGTGTKQMVDIVWQFLTEEDPEWRRYSAYSLTADALRKQWPCGSQERHAGLAE